MFNNLAATHPSAPFNVSGALTISLTVCAWLVLMLFANQTVTWLHLQTFVTDLPLTRDTLVHLAQRSMLLISMTILLGLASLRRMAANNATLREWCDETLPICAASAATIMCYLLVAAPATLHAIPAIVGLVTLLVTQPPFTHWVKIDRRMLYLIGSSLILLSLVVPS